MPLTIDNPESQPSQRFQTIDNLQPKEHQRFIDATQLLNDEEVQKITQTPGVAQRAEILKTAPKYSEIDLLWQVQEKETSPFIEPEGFVLTTDILTHALIPNLGSVSEIIQKLESIKDQKDSEVERQRKILVKSIKDYSSLNEMLKYIKRKQEEFHKG